MVPLLDLKRDWPEIKEEVEEGWREITSSMRLLNGPYVQAFEKEAADYFGSSFAFGVGSGTEALWLALIACGLGPGDEVLVPANGFVADVEAIKWAGATPVLVDAREEDFGPELSDLKEKLSPRTKALLVVHMYGHPLEMDEILSFCREHDLFLIEDASHAHGAEYKGRKVGTFGQVGCFSCGVVKNLNALGDAGLVLTDDPEIAHRLKFLRVHGQVQKNNHEFYGFNARLDEMQAVVLRARLRRLETKNQRRREIARFYQERLADLEGLSLPPLGDEEKKPVFHRYVIRTQRRDELMAHLRAKGIGTGIYYPVPLHLQPAWQKEGYPPYHLPVSEKLAREILAIPLFPELTPEELEEVVEAVREFFR